MKPSLLFATFALLSLSAFAEDTISFTTATGRTFHNAAISRVEPSGLQLMTSDGIERVAFAELPADLQKRFGYDPAKAAQYDAAVAQTQAQMAARARALHQAQAQRDAQAPSPVEVAMPAPPIAPAESAPRLGPVGSNSSLNRPGGGLASGGRNFGGSSLDAPARPTRDSIEPAGTRKVRYSEGQAVRIVGTVIQNLPDGLIIDCAPRASGQSGAKRAEEIVLLRGDYDLNAGKPVDASVIYGGEYRYTSLFGSRMVIPAFVRR